MINTVHSSKDLIVTVTFKLCSLQNQESLLLWHLRVNNHHGDLLENVLHADKMPNDPATDTTERELSEKACCGVW